MITGIHHATFLIGDMSKARTFYEDVLGLRPDAKRPQMSYDGVWYDVTPNQQLHLMLLADPTAGVQRPVHGGRDRHVALLVDDLNGLAQRFLQQNVPFTLSQSGRRALFCRDPDGNALEFIEVAA